MDYEKKSETMLGRITVQSGDHRCDRETDINKTQEAVSLPAV